MRLLRVRRSDIATRPYDESDHNHMELISHPHHPAGRPAAAAEHPAGRGIDDDGTADPGDDHANQYRSPEPGERPIYDDVDHRPNRVPRPDAFDLADAEYHDDLGPAAWLDIAGPVIR